MGVMGMMGVMGVMGMMGIKKRRDLDILSFLRNFDCAEVTYRTSFQSALLCETEVSVVANRAKHFARSEKQKNILLFSRFCVTLDLKH